MLKQRIIPKFLIQDGRLVKGVRYHENFREAGNPVTTAHVYDSYGVDELIFLDIQATLESRKTVTGIIERVSEKVFMPLTVGGGIQTLEDVNGLLRAGADKVSVCTAAVEQAGFIRAAARTFGDQCMTVCIDYKEVQPGVARVCTHGGQRVTDREPIEFARHMQDSNCGEVILCSIDRDGTMQGFDLEMIQRATAALDVPVIASSGAGSLKDCMDALTAGASAITVSSLFLFTDQSPIKVRSFLSSNHLNVRASRSSRN